MARLDGKAGFITGGGSGIGRAAAVLFAREGSKVAVADIDVAGGEETLRQIEADGGKGLFVETDVTKPESVEAMVAATVEAFGRLDIVYNNAGGSTSRDGPVTEAPVDEFWRAISLDLFGTFLGCKYGIPELIKSGGGSVINMSSNVALMAIPGRDCYTAAKGGVAAMTRSMAAEYAAHNIRVNAIAPSTTRTPRVQALVDADPALEKQLNTHLLGIGEPEDIAYAALYLASDEARITTGQVIPVDSGITVV